MTIKTIYSQVNLLHLQSLQIVEFDEVSGTAFEFHSAEIRESLNMKDGCAYINDLLILCSALKLTLQNERDMCGFNQLDS